MPDPAPTSAITRRFRSPIVLATGLFLTATLVMFFDVLVTTPNRIPSVAGEDAARIFLYWNLFAFEELRHGHVVLWNPHSFAGAPFLAGFQPGLLYPPNWLHMVLPPARAINVGIALHVFLAGLWTYLWTRHRGLHPSACILAGLVFMFCGAHFLQLYRGHLPHLHTLIWAPLVFLAIDGVVATAALRWMLIGMAAVALQIVAGNVQYVHHTAIMAAIYALGRWLVRGAPWRVGVGLVAIYLGGASLAAMQLLPGLAAVPESLRAQLSYGTAAGGALPPENVLTFVLPALFGEVDAYWGRWTLSETSLFVGMAPFALAVYGLVRGDRRLVLSCVAMAAIALVLALGDHTPLFAVLYDHVPGFRSVRGIAKFGVLASAFVAMLVAVGFDLVLRDPRRTWGMVAGAVLAGVVLGASGVALRSDCTRGGRTLWNPMLNGSAIFLDARMFFEDDPKASPRACHGAASSLLLGAATLGTIAGLLLGARRVPRLAYGVALVGVLEVMAYARFTRPTFDAASVLARVAEARRGFERFGDSRVASSDPLQYLALAAGGFDAWGSADLVLERYARFLQSTQNWHVEAVLVTAGLGTLKAPLGMLRLGHRLELSDGQPTFQPTGLDVLPRALLVPRWEVLPDRDAVLKAMQASTFDPRHLVYLESEPGIATGDGEATGTVSVRDVSTEIMEITADVRRPAVLLVTDNYSRGWSATAVGDPRRAYAILPANSTLRAIPLMAGRHHIRLEYRPRAFVVGTYVTLVSLAAFAAAVTIEWRRRRSGPPRPS